MREKSRPREKSRTRSPNRVTSNLPNYYDIENEPRTPRLNRKKSVGKVEDERFHDCHDHRSGRNKKKNRAKDKDFNNNSHDNDREVMVTADKNGMYLQYQQYAYYFTDTIYSFYLKFKIFT